MPPRIKPNTAFLKTVSEGVDPLFKASRGGPRIIEADIGRIVPNPHQPRRHFDEAELQALRDSIERHGLQQPVGLKQLEPGRWQLVYGERRLRACQMLGKVTIFGVLVQGDDEEIALVENIQRADLSPLEEAAAFQRLMDRHGYSQGTLGRIVGRDRTEVNRTLSLNRLPDAIRAEYPLYRPARYRLYKLAAEKDPAVQAALWENIKRECRSSADGESDSRSPVREKNPRHSKEERAFASLLRAARAVTRDTAALEALRRTSQPLPEDDRERLQQLRDTIDAILAGRP